MTGQDDDSSSSPAWSPTGSMSPARTSLDVQIQQVDRNWQDESLTRALAQMDVDNLMSQDAFRENRYEPVWFEHLAQMDELRVRLTTIDHNAGAQTRSSPRPTYSSDDVSQDLGERFRPEASVDFHSHRPVRVSRARAHAAR